MNAILGVVQEGRAEHAIEALKEMTASTCKVIRGGQLLAVKSEEIVVGDIVVLEAAIPYPQTAVFSSAPPSRRRNPL